MTGNTNAVKFCPFIEPMASGLWPLPSILIVCILAHIKINRCVIISTLSFNIFTVLVTICALINEGIILTKIWYDEERGIEYNKSGVGIKTLYLASIFGMFL